MTMIKRKIHVICLISILLVTIISATIKFDQPITYNHKLHIEEVGLTCIDCHVNAETQARAVIPNISLCGECHDDVEAESPEQRKVAEYVLNSRNIPWIQVNLMPDYVYFSHRRHVVLGKIECKTCHGEVEQMEYPFMSSHLTMDMAWCMNCHEQRLVTNDCNTCHR
jgi:hypothetical protein